jgi:hypothetical protein
MHKVFKSMFLYIVAFEGEGEGEGEGVGVDEERHLHPPSHTFTQSSIHPTPTR